MGEGKLIATVKAPQSLVLPFFNEDTERGVTTNFVSEDG